MKKLIKARKIINRTDRKMAGLFEKRMSAADMIARYKFENGLAVTDEKRERDLIAENLGMIHNTEYLDYYTPFLKNTISISKDYQQNLIDRLRSENEEKTDTVKETCIINVDLTDDSYPIVIGRGIIGKANEYFNLDRKVFIVTDKNVPVKYSESIAKLCKKATLYTVDPGEGSKNLGTLEALISQMAEAEIGRDDCIVAVGGGVIGDLCGFASAIYMRGIDFYNVPTTLLAQVDSSVGGKTAVNLSGIKNIIGAFKQPRCVLIDPDVLATLPKRHISNGLSEAIKMSVTCNKELFEFFENSDCSDVMKNIDRVIYESVLTKKAVVEEDVFESDKRRVLNFGHTLGHGIESASGFEMLLHGECVAIGMLPVCDVAIKERVISVLEKFDLPTVYEGDIHSALEFIANDKKMSNDGLNVVLCNRIGCYELAKMTKDEFEQIVIKCFK